MITLRRVIQADGRESYFITANMAASPAQARAIFFFRQYGWHRTKKDVSYF